MDFTFFFDGLYYDEVVHQAFKIVCIDKMLSDGYFDMSIYINARMKKDDIRGKLIAAKSRYKVLYDGTYSTKKNAISDWKEKKGRDLYYDDLSVMELSYDESAAIVNWIYRVLKDAKEREIFTKELFSQLKELHEIERDICFSQGVFYNKKKVDIHFISSITGFNNFIADTNGGKRHLFYRGHANANYLLLPSVMRTRHFECNEREMYHELLINCPDDFEKCHTHLEKLVEMQHYGLPTRLLDITRNPLVALYFACESQFDAYGEIVLISADEHEIKYPQSDTISILASIPVFSYDMQRQFCMWAEDGAIDDKKFNNLAKRLIHEVRLEKPAFESEINKEDILKNYIVYALKNNSRIVKQDGAFIICGLRNSRYSLDEFRYREKGKKIIVLITQKKRILQKLDAFSINRATLFPEIDFVSEYIKNKYS